MTETQQEAMDVQHYVSLNTDMLVLLLHLMFALEDAVIITEMQLKLVTMETQLIMTDAPLSVSLKQTDIVI